MSEKLKPCPLCGGEAHIEHGAILWAVVCPCASHVFYGCEQSAEKTVNAWNTSAERTCRIETRDIDGIEEEFCTACGNEVACYYRPHYCPNCGAKVVE